MELLYEHPVWTSIWLLIITLGLSSVGNITIRRGNEDE